MQIPFRFALLAVVVVSAAVGWGLSHDFTGSSAAPTSAPIRHHAARAVHRAVKGRPPHLAHGWSYVARARGHRLVIYRRAHSHRVRLVLSNPNSEGAPLTLLVKRAVPGWLELFLPVRPNHATGWVRLHSVKLFTTAYALVVHLHSHRMRLVIANRVRHTFRIGVGQSVTPTPSGRYFITELLKQPDPTGVYGPYAFGLSAYSGVLTHFGRGGNGQIGIHGTDEPGRLGTDVSHGCVRLSNHDITWLAKRLPLGLPVTIDRA